jgi:hypothetical protein
MYHRCRALHGSPMGDPFKNGKPMGTHLLYCKYLFSNQILSDKMHIGWKLHFFYIYSYKQHFHIGNVSRDIEGFLINPQLKCFEIFLIFHGLLLWLLKKIVMKIFVNRSQESLEKNSWVPIAIRALHGSPMGPHWGNCKYLFSNQILSVKVHIVWKLLYFCIDSNEEHCNIEIGSRSIWGFLKSFQFKCFEIFLIFHGLLLWLQKKI